MKIYSHEEIPQGSPEWFDVRKAMPTASMFSAVMAKPGPRGGIAKTRQTYLYKLAGEILTDEPMESWSNAHMERGKEREAEARTMYTVMKEVAPEQVGFVVNGNCGCSPDSLVGDDGMLEIKDAMPHIQIERLLANRLPPEHVAQVQGQMMVCEREWCDFMSHCRGIRPLVVRVERDEKYIAGLRRDIDTFVSELNELVERLR